MDSRETTSSRQASDEGSKRKHDLSSQIKSKRLKLAEKNKFLDRYLRPLECGLFSLASFDEDLITTKNNV